MNEQQVMELVCSILGVQPLTATHMAFGHNSITYDVALPNRNVIVRTNLDAKVFAKTEYNLTILTRLGLPVPRVLVTDLTKNNYPFAYMLLEKIPGRDLRYGLGNMTPTQMTRVAEQIVFFQRQVATLPIGKGFGYVPIGEQGPFSSWLDLVQFEMNRVVNNADIPVLDEWKVQLNHLLRKYKSYLEQLQPVCFLDDVTTKNVIVLHGELQGLIDFDCVCYGDPLWTIGLTKTAIVSEVGIKALFYVEELCRIGQLTIEQRRIVDLYAAIHALNFIQRLMTKEGSEWVARMTKITEGWIKKKALLLPYNSCHHQHNHNCTDTIVEQVQDNTGPDGAGAPAHEGERESNEEENGERAEVGMCNGEEE